MSAATQLRDALGIETLHTEHGLSTEAAAESAAQVRELPDLLKRAQRPDSDIRPLDAAKIASAVLAVDARLQAQAERARRALTRAQVQASKGE